MGYAEAQPYEQYDLSDDVIQDILDALHSGYEDKVVESIDELSAADAARFLEKISEEDRKLILNDYSAVFKPATYPELNADLRYHILEFIGPEQIAAVISELESDDALQMIVHLEEDQQKEVIKNLSRTIRVTLQEGLKFPEDSAGRLMQREYVSVPKSWTVGKTIDFLRAGADELPEEFFNIFVITQGHNVLATLSLSKIMRSPRSAKIKDLIPDETIVQIPVDMDQEDVAQIFRRNHLTSAPVIDEKDRMIGVITIDDVVNVINIEAEEDFLRLAGIEQGSMYGAIMSTTASRFRWLLINLFTAIMASAVISLFDTTLQEIVAVAILMPIVASMGGNAGTQSLTVAVRALANRQLSRTNALRMIFKETLVGSINGIVFAMIIGATTSYWFDNSTLGAVIASSMVINLFVAGLFGASIPIILDRMGSDPAVSSTVLLTTVTDVIGFFVFLGLATMVLS